MNINIEVINNKCYIEAHVFFKKMKQYKDKIKDLEEERKKQDEFIEYWQGVADRKQNIIDIIKAIFNDLDNHFDDDCDCEKIEKLLESIEE